MNSESSKHDAVEFLKYSISHIENRIGMIDVRSSILVAGIGAMTSGYVYLITSLLGHSFEDLVKLIILGVVSVFGVSAFLLILAIRPTPNPLGYAMKSGRETTASLKRNYMWPREGFNRRIWFENDRIIATALRDHIEEASEISEHEILLNLQATNFVLLGHVNRKMTYYSIAIFVTKLGFLASVISTIVIHLDLLMYLR